jgi:uncharacterized OB-fold protein
MPVTETETPGVALLTAGREQAFSVGSKDEAPHLWGIKCRDCGAYDFPPSRHCPRCSSGAVDRVALSRRGTLHVWSTVLQDPGPSFVGEKPYTIVTVELPEGIRVVSTLAGQIEPERLKRGLELELALVQVGEREGVPVYDFRFKAL